MARELWYPLDGGVGPRASQAKVVKRKPLSLMDQTPAIQLAAITD